MKKSIIKKSTLTLCAIAIGAVGIAGFAPLVKAADDDLIENKRPRKVLKTAMRNMLNFRAEHPLSQEQKEPVSYTHLTLPTTPYV